MENMLKIMDICHSQREFGDEYDKTIMDTATKTGIDAEKTKRVIQKLQKQQGV